MVHRRSASPLAPTFNGQRVRDWDFRNSPPTPVLDEYRRFVYYNTGGVPDVLPSPFTTAQMDTRIFGEHSGLRMPGPIIRAPIPVAQSNVPYWMLTQKQNPWYMAPGWNAQLRKIDTKFYAGRSGMYVGTFEKNPWDKRYGHINGQQITQNLAAVRARQMSNVSYI